MEQVCLPQLAADHEASKASKAVCYTNMFHPSSAQAALQMNIIGCSTPHLHKLHYK